MIEAELRAKGPYSLRASGRAGSDATRVVAEGVVTATITVEDQLERVRAWQRGDGVVCVRADSEAGVEHARFILGLIVFTTGFLYARRQRWGRVALDWSWLHLPILGSVIRKVTISRSLRTLATTINAGVPMLEALQLSGGVANNIFYEETWNRVADQVTSGKQIYEALEGNRLFPSTLLQMISSGESTGKLGQVLNKVSDYYDREVATSIKSATSMIEPIMVAVMGGVIGTIALAMLLPIFTLSSHVG